MLTIQGLNSIYLEALKELTTNFTRRILLGVNVQVQVTSQRGSKERGKVVDLDVTTIKGSDFIVQDLSVNSMSVDISPTGTLNGNVGIQDRNQDGSVRSSGGTVKMALGDLVAVVDDQRVHGLGHVPLPADEDVRTRVTLDRRDFLLATGEGPALIKDVVLIFLLLVAQMTMATHRGGSIGSGSDKGGGYSEKKTRGKLHVGKKIRDD